MDHLASILDGKSHFLKSYDGYNVTVNTTKLAPIIQYFSLYSLKTKKYITYLNLIKIHTIIANNKHKDDNGLLLINKYKNSMNKLNNYKK